MTSWRDVTKCLFTQNRCTSTRQKNNSTHVYFGELKSLWELITRPWVTQRRSASPKSQPWHGGWLMKVASLKLLAELADDPTREPPPKQLFTAFRTSGPCESCDFLSLGAFYSLLNLINLFLQSVMLQFGGGSYPALYTTAFNLYPWLYLNTFNKVGRVQQDASI